MMMFKGILRQMSVDAFEAENKLDFGRISHEVGHGGEGYDDLRYPMSNVSWYFRSRKHIKCWSDPLVISRHET